jgi:hypothetical protein
MYTCNNNNMSQKLSPKAARDKAARDKKYAMTPRRTKMKAENQRRHRANPSADDKDYDHTNKRFESAKANRGGHGKGTKVESKQRKR